MFLYLSSFKLDDKSKLHEMFHSGYNKVAIISNSRDFSNDKARKLAGLQFENDSLRKIGLESEELDLRKYFGKQNLLKYKLQEFAGVWVLGGNTFVLRRAFKESGFDTWLHSQKENSEFVYSGYSAGVCVLQKNLQHVAQIDDPNVYVEGYPDEIIYEGVGLIDFEFVPHYNSPGHKETDLANSLVEYYKNKNISFKALEDGEFIVLTTH